MPANQNGCNPATFQAICCNEIPRIRGAVILLTATQAKFINCREEVVKLSFPDDQFGASSATIERKLGFWSLQDRDLSRESID
jgi:hypothetical protein